MNDKFVANYIIRNNGECKIGSINSCISCIYNRYSSLYDCIFVSDNKDERLQKVKKYLNKNKIKLLIKYL